MSFQRHGACNLNRVNIGNKNYIHLIWVGGWTVERTGGRVEKGFTGEWMVEGIGGRVEKGFTGG